MLGAPPSPLRPKTLLVRGWVRHFNLSNLAIDLSYELDEVPPKFPFFLFSFFPMSQFDWSITQKKKKNTMEAPPK
jgi:hypothetical protein